MASAVAGGGTGFGLASRPSNTSASAPAGAKPATPQSGSFGAPTQPQPQPQSGSFGASPQPQPQPQSAFGAPQPQPQSGPAVTKQPQAAPSSISGAPTPHPQAGPSSISGAPSSISGAPAPQPSAAAPKPTAPQTQPQAQPQSVPSSSLAGTPAPQGPGAKAPVSASLAGTPASQAPATGVAVKTTVSGSLAGSVPTVTVTAPGPVVAKVAPVAQPPPVAAAVSDPWFYVVVDEDPSTKNERTQIVEFLEKSPLAAKKLNTEQRGVNANIVVIGHGAQDRASFYARADCQHFPVARDCLARLFQTWFSGRLTVHACIHGTPHPSMSTFFERTVFQARAHPTNVAPEFIDYIKKLAHI
eukprot:gnl/Spiro4/1324_TR708_c0_g1_i2.p1 gnl/Spiro4/1324_TR708_c0_g1~~gnl/Spiro4/1324_TR708_c0_g1_i2.p1  ORF type:complete len:369 (-),score=45.24 gnl/Spiro4/1324_TR708_c0_g1_i2:59-1129(-)